MTADVDMNESKQARRHDELIAELLDSRIPKTEREHAAAREIEKLRAQQPEALRAEVARLNRLLGRIVEGDGDSTLTIRAGTDAFAAAREYLTAPKPTESEPVEHGQRVRLVAIGGGDG